MIKSKLLEILKNFTARERTDFKKYVFSPYFNSHEQIQALYIYILAGIPKYDPSYFKRERVYKDLFKNENYDKFKLNHLISYLLQLLYDYLEHQQYKRNQILQKQLLLNELLDRELLDHFNKNAIRLEQIQAKTPCKNSRYYYNEYVFNHLLDKHHLSKGLRIYNEALQNKSDHLDYFYFSSKLKIACEMASRNNILHQQYESLLLDDVLILINNSPDLSGKLVIAVYQKLLYVLSNNQGEMAYDNLAQKVEENVTLFPKDEIRSIYGYFLNYCIKKINEGKSQYYRKIFELYKTCLTHEIIFEKGKLSRWAYKNITTVGLRLKEYDWVEQFILNYQNYLSEEDKTSAVASNLAAFYFAKKEYGNALEELQKVNLVHTSYQTSVKILQLKCYYELNEIDAFFSLSEAFRKYIKREKNLSDYHKKTNTNFLKLAKKIFQLKINNNLYTLAINRQKIKVIQKQLEEVSPVSNKQWLANVLEEIQP